MILIGIDVGGTKVSISLSDHQGIVLENVRLATKSLGGAKTGLDTIKKTIQSIIKEHGFDFKQLLAIGLAIPGPISVLDGKILTPPNLPDWQGVEIVSYFKKNFQCPVFMNNDANANALAEWQFGRKSQNLNLVYLTASTGMGGGIILGGHLLQGITDTGGEVGHFILDIHGPQCSCGQKGCFEAYCGGASMAKRLQQAIRKEGISTKMVELVDGDLEKIDMKVFVHAVKDKDPYALLMWDEYVERFAQGIGMLIMTLNPEVIVLGTIATHVHDLLMEPLKEKIKKYAWKRPLEACRIEESRLGDDMGRLSGVALAMYGLKQPTQ